MTRPGLRWLRTVMLAFTLAAVQQAAAGIIYVTDSAGNVWRYDGIADMEGQNSTTNTGTLVRDAATAGNDYFNDQDATMDLSSGKIYRVANGGNVFSYPTIEDYLANTNRTTETPGGAVYTSGSNRKLNGLSYDGNTNGFYAVSAITNTTTSAFKRGDILIFNSLAAFLAGTPDTFIEAGYNNAVLNFYDPDTTPATSVGNMSFPSYSFNAQYYQVAGNGNLEGFESIAKYDENAVNRDEFTGNDSFGTDDTTVPIDPHPYQAVAAFAVPFPEEVPEPASLLLCLFAVACGLTAKRSR
jgi:hypothetical protein